MAQHPVWSIVLVAFGRRRGTDDLEGPYRANRQADGENGAELFAVAVRHDGASVHFNKMFHDRKPQPQPSELPARAAVHLPKTVKNVGQQVGTDTLPAVAYRKLPVGLLTGQVYADRAVLGCELDGVG